MLQSKREKFASAAQHANEKFTKAAAREAEFLREKQKQFEADAAKTARLRALRLAKEGADREALAKEIEEKRAAAAAARLGRRARKTVANE
jgi:hypothetical protein